VDKEARLQKLINQKLGDIENTRLKIIVGGKEVVVKEQVGKVVHTILSVMDFIRVAVSVEPHAALAWAGVLVILPVRVCMSISFPLLCTNICFAGCSEPSHTK
jgi:hypothetical protein